MTTDEIKSEMARRGITIRQMARDLHMNESVLGGILGGKRPMTDRLKSHIELYLTPVRDRMLVYRIDFLANEVQELVGDHQNMTDAELDACLQSVVRHNLALLAKRGAMTDAWTDEMRAAMGLPPNGQPWEPGPEDFGLTAAEDDGSDK